MSNVKLYSSHHLAVDWMYSVIVVDLVPKERVKMQKMNVSHGKRKMDKALIRGGLPCIYRLEVESSMVFCSWRWEEKTE
jgi:hypothetical protein